MFVSSEYCHLIGLSWCEIEIRVILLNLKYSCGKQNECYLRAKAEMLFMNIILKPPFLQLRMRYKRHLSPYSRLSVNSRWVSRMRFWDYIQLRDCVCVLYFFRSQYNVHRWGLQRKNIYNLQKGQLPPGLIQNWGESFTLLSHLLHTNVTITPKVGQQF